MCTDINRHKQPQLAVEEGGSHFYFGKRVYFQISDEVPQMPDDIYDVNSSLQLVEFSLPTCHFLQIGALLLPGGTRPPAAGAAQIKVVNMLKEFYGFLNNVDSYNTSFS